MFDSVLCFVPVCDLVFLFDLAWDFPPLAGRDLQSEDADVACGRRPLSGPLSGPVSGPASGNPGIYSI